jgi:hypothetical protein
MSYRIVVTLALMAFVAVAEARNPSLKMPSFDHLEGKAVESVDITFGRMPLRFASWFIPDEDPEGLEVKKMLKSIRSLHVCHYRFDSDFVYSAKDVDSVRSQLEEKGWSQVVQVRDRKKDEDVDVFIAVEDEKITGLTIVASQPREFTIVNIVGRIDFDQIERWRTQFESKGHRKWGPPGPRGRDEDWGPDEAAAAAATANSTAGL